MPNRRNRDFCKINVDTFVNNLSSQDWDLIYSIDDPDLSYNSFLSIFKRHYNACFPFKKHTIHAPRKDWCSPGIVNSCRTKSKLYKKYIKNPTTANKHNYVLFRNRLNSVIRIAKKNYYSNLFQHSNIKETWACINTLTKNNSPKTIPKELNVNGRTVTDDGDICESLNNYFTNIGPNLASTLADDTTDPLKFMNDSNCSSFFMLPTDESEVFTCLNNLKNSSAGFDEIQAKVVKSVSLYISKPLCHIINLSFSKGIVPANLKIARVVPVFKGGQPDVIGNYRPISVLPCFSKVFERLTFDRLYSFLLNNNSLYSHQFGFLPGKNTSQAIISVVDHIVKSFDNKHLTCGIFLDLSKAFDTLDHSILLNKLCSYGIRGVSHSWFLSYLSNRLQYVSVHNATSTYSNTVCGVPQGSILGPLLFLLYINDLPNVSSSLKFVLYADDTNILYSAPDINSLIAHLNSELPNIITWFHSNKLHLNANKSTAILFRPQQKHINISDFHIKLGPSCLPFSNSTKFLGVIIDEHLSWNYHTNTICNKISKGIGILRRLRCELPRKILLIIYNNLILPYLSYCCIIWGFTYFSNINKLHIQQKKAVRAICNVPYNSHSLPLFRELNILTIFDLINYHTSIFMYHYCNGSLPDIFVNYFANNNHYHTYNTRNASNLSTPFYKLNICHNFLHYRAVHIWNALPDCIKDCPTIFSFKRKLKSHMLKSMK